MISFTITKSISGFLPPFSTDQVRRAFAYAALLVCIGQSDSHSAYLLTTQLKQRTVARHFIVQVAAVRLHESSEGRTPFGLFPS